MTTCSQRIEDYALIGNSASAGLVGKNGSLDWLCLPRFDSDACFAALLGSEDNGYWSIAPRNPEMTVTRRYRPGTLVLETEFTTPEGCCVLIDCMDRDGEVQHVVRIVRGIRGCVPMRMQGKVRTEYGSVVPWVSRMPDDRMKAIAGPHQFVLSASVEVRGEGLSTVAEFSVSPGQEVSFVLSWRQSHLPPPDSPNAAAVLDRVSAWWENWSAQHVIRGPYHEAVLRSLITLKAFAHDETGGIVAAVTTSLPEEIGGPRNWDYRYCWLRDATFTLYALIQAGFTDEARKWREWLLRAIAGSPDQMQILYGVAGERRLNEFELPWLTGYQNSSPVRVGNAASEQLQLDVFGEVVDLLFQARRAGLAHPEDSWNLERALVQHLVKIWRDPDSGIWEVRGPKRHFTHSKVMAWVALDRAIRTAEELGVECPLPEWRVVREQIHQETCANGFNSRLDSFTQYFGGETLDASLLLLPLVGFLPPEDPRIVGTIRAIENALVRDGFVARYNTESKVDGVSGEEGVFLACSFWLVDNYLLQGRPDDARNLFDRLLALRNDVGLLAEEYNPRSHRQVGNFPQAFSHVALINSAHNLCMANAGPAQGRSSTV